MTTIEALIFKIDNLQVESQQAGKISRFKASVEKGPVAIKKKMNSSRYFIKNNFKKPRK